MSATDALRSFAESREHDAITIRHGLCYGDVRQAVAEIERLRAERDALREALTSIANRECGDEDEASRLANRCLRQIDAARKE
jgi:hypothetical protein